MPNSLLSSPTASQLDQACAVIPALETALARFAGLRAVESIEQELALAKEIAGPLFADHETLFRELLCAEVAATSESDAPLRAYFAMFASAEFTPLNGEGLLRFMLALFCAITGAPSEWIEGDELTPMLPPQPPA